MEHVSRNSWAQEVATCCEKWIQQNGPGSTGATLILDDEPVRSWCKRAAKNLVTLAKVSLLLACLAHIPKQLISFSESLKQDDYELECRMLNLAKSLCPHEFCRLEKSCSSNHQPNTVFGRINLAHTQVSDWAGETSIVEWLIHEYEIFHTLQEHDRGKEARWRKSYEDGRREKGCLGEDAR